MKITRIQIIIILLSVNCHLLVSNKLDLGKCMTGDITSAHVVYGESNSILESLQTRSLLACVDLCLTHALCYGALFSAPSRADLHGICYLLDSSYLITTRPAPSSHVMLSGRLVSMVQRLKDKRTGVDLCSDVTCAEGATCYHMCEEGRTTPYPYCLTDNRDCEIEEEYTNVRHYVSDIYKTQGDGIFQTVTYYKSREDSAVRVIYSTSFGGHLDSERHCTKFYVTFDGAECTNPEPIHRVSYSAQAGRLHRTENIDGTCYGLDSGSITIELRTSECYIRGPSASDVGWKSTRHLTIMEIIPHITPLTLPCPGLSVFNYQYKAIGGHIVSNYTQTVFTSDVYRKLANDSDLRVKFQATLRVYIIEELIYCARWSLYVDDITECSPVGDMLVHCLSASTCFDYHQNFLEGQTLEAVCENLPAGDHVIKVKIERCESRTTTPRLTTGWESGQRMHIEEIRPVQRLDGVISSNGRILKNTFQNVFRHHQVSQNIMTLTEAPVITLNYTKQRDDTELRLTASGTHNVAHQDTNNCARWYFTVNGVESSMSGVEGVYSFNYDTSFNQPMQVTGIYDGVASGMLEIAYNSGNCQDVSGMGIAVNGGSAAFNIIVEEVSLESFSLCSSGDPINCD